MIELIRDDGHGEFERVAGPIELKESLTNGNKPFEKECIDLFHIEEDDVGDLTSLALTLEAKGKRSCGLFYWSFIRAVCLENTSHGTSSAKCER